MTVAQWLLPVLWREHDWRSALERLCNQLAASSASQARAACELGRAFEYIEPDRRRAIAAYELADNDGGRALAIATEIGWWSARARLIAAQRGHDPVDEAEAWWDAGQPDLCALALAGVHGARSERAEDLAALVAERDLADRAAEAVARALGANGRDAADAYVMAARLSRAAGRTADVTRWLDEALAADPGHPTAASFSLALVRRDRDPAQLQKVLKLRVADADPITWIDRTRAAAFTLLDSEHHRGFGLRLLREALERSYQSRQREIPGHLAIWTVLAAHASAGHHRRELLPLVLEALQATQRDVDRVWLGALATEITLRDANHPVVAGAYAEIVAEHAPEHPVLRELVTAVATAESDPTPEDPPAPQQVPAAAKSAATTRLEEHAFDIDIDDAYAEAEAMIEDADIEEIVDVEAAKPALTPTRPGPSKPAPAKSAPTKPVPTPIKPVAVAPIAAAEPTSKPGPAKPAPVAAEPKPAPAAAKATSTGAPAPVVAKAAPAVTKPVAAATPPAPSLAPSKTAPQIAPASVVQPAAPAKSASIVPVSMSNAASIIPSAMRKKPDPKKQPQQPITGLPALAAPKAIPKPIKDASSAATTVLAALRTPHSPVLPPPKEDPPDARVRARRIAIAIDVRLISGGKRIAATSADISTSGLFVLTSDTGFAVGDTLAIELLLPGKEAFVEDEYRSQARIARRAADGYGIELVDPEPALLEALSAL